MGARLYVGNLPFQATDQELTALFSRVGQVASARVMRDIATGRARGFGFVDMATDQEAQRAVSELHQFQMDGRALVVNEVQSKGRGLPVSGAGPYEASGTHLGDSASFWKGRCGEPRW